MSDVVVPRIREAAESALVDATWAQWSALTSTAVPGGQRRVWTIVDPEALVLASVAVGHRERRLQDLAASWAGDAAYLISLQRMRSLASRFPEAVGRGLRGFARAAVAGGDRRWSRLASGQTEGEYVPRVKPLGSLPLMEGPALTLRLRAGFGVNAKADVLSLLLGLAGAPADLKLIAAATAYTERAARTAAEEMALAGFIQKVEGRPPSFHAQAKAWGQVLHGHRPDSRGLGPAVPPWRFWAAGFAFLAGVLEWAQRVQGEDWSPYVASSRARDLVERHARPLRQARLDVPRSNSARGAEYLLELEDLVRRVQEWTNEGLGA
jgi:hypothetical protein